MRELNEDESALRDERRVQFEAFRSEVADVLIDLAQGLQLPSPRALIDEPGEHLAAIDHFVSNAELDPQLRSQLLARIGCLAGELLVARLDGRWLMDETPDSPHFLHFTVGAFAQLSSLELMADPFAVAAAYLDQLEVKDLAGLIEAVVGELFAVQPEGTA
jgi:hypothetical protein